MYLDECVKIHNRLAATNPQKASQILATQLDIIEIGVARIEDPVAPNDADPNESAANIQTNFLREKFGHRLDR